MRLEEELAELLAGLEVVLEDTPPAERGRTPAREPFETSDEMHVDETEDDDQSELCLFQT